MDQHGFPAAPQRGPRRPVAISIPLRAVPAVSLAEPRPEAERRDNEYVETPLRGQPPPPLFHAHHPLHRPPAPPPPPAPVAKQPLSFSKTSAAAAAASTNAAAALAPECSAAGPSIMCADCGRCRCATCRAPRPLPERWACNGACLVSSDTIVDYASCLCCAKGLFYHCSEADDEGNSCANDPCGCGPDRRAARWGCLAVLACALPCLWFYWPMRCAKRGLEMCYARQSRQGCRCRPKEPPQPTDKRLLSNDSL
ncbi:sprouty signaling antagonist [Rhynchophorus ferrugineus]|uniref:sprouty signaling antagonist n=1 Tax=Rhynchophorus ferrugineus TaxID=354439 RepID=UPI003FCD1A66